MFNEVDDTFSLSTGGDKTMSPYSLCPMECTDYKGYQWEDFACYAPDMIQKY